MLTDTLYRPFRPTYHDASFTGVKVQNLDPTPRPLDHLTLRGQPTAPALITREGVIDYAGLEQKVASAAAALRARGLAEGDRVASWLPKGLITALLPLACARARLVHVPINPLLKRLQVSHILADCSARLLISGEARLAPVAAELAGLLDRHLEALDLALAGGEAEGLGPAAGRLVGVRDLLRRTVAIGGRPVSDVTPSV